MDPTNLNGKVQKHQNFEVELHSNKTRFDEVVATGEDLIESGHLQSEKIRSKIEEIKHEVQLDASNRHLNSNKREPVQ